MALLTWSFGIGVLIPSAVEAGLTSTCCGLRGEAHGLENDTGYGRKWVDAMIVCDASLI